MVELGISTFGETTALEAKESSLEAKVAYLLPMQSQACLRAFYSVYACID